MLRRCERRGGLVRTTSETISWQGPKIRSEAFRSVLSSTRGVSAQPLAIPDRSLQNESDPAKLTSFYHTSVEELAVLKRSAIVNSVYGGRKLVVEKDKIERTRGVN